MAKRLLLADDSLTIQKVVGISFANEDVHITTVDNGDDALVRVREIRPDIVLADVVMPGKNGYEVCAAIKGDPELGHVPVLLLTGTFEAFDEERARRVRADGHITKPFEAQTLVDEVNRLLARAARPQPQPAPAAAPAHASAAESRPTLVTPPPPAPAPAAAPAAPSAPAADDAFDFFDEDLSLAPAPAPVPAAPAPAPLAAPEPAPAATAFELDSGESGFDFAPVVEEPAHARTPAEASTVVVSAPSFAPHSDQTIALGAADVAADDDWPSGEDLDAAFEEDGLAALDLELERPRAERATPVPAEKPTVLDFDGGGDAAEAEFDFGFESRDRGATPRDPLADFDTPDAAREALLDPDAANAFAVSSSDLGSTPRVVPAPPARAALPEPELTGESDFGPEPQFSPRPDLDEDEDELPAYQPAPPPARAQARPAAAVPAADALSPAVRERVHDSLEKIAWEAFADLPDTIVRQAVAKIEEIAWEVIPQMAEALIREEIRRLKGEA